MFNTETSESQAYIPLCSGIAGACSCSAGPASSPWLLSIVELPWLRRRLALHLTSTRKLPLLASRAVNELEAVLLPLDTTMQLFPAASVTVGVVLAYMLLIVGAGVGACDGK